MSVVATAVIDFKGVMHTLHNDLSHPDLVNYLLETSKIRYRSEVEERGFLLEDGSFCTRLKASKFFKKPLGSLAYSTDLRNKDITK